MEGIPDRLSEREDISAADDEPRPVFFYDLSAVAGATASTLLHDPETLRDVCEQHLANLQTRDVTVFTENGFYLVVHSANGDRALALAKRVNRALLKLFFGPNEPSPEQMVPIFRIAQPEELERYGGMPAPATATTRSMWRTESADPRDRFIQFAITGESRRENVQLGFVPIHDLVRNVPALYLCLPEARHGSRLVHGRAAFRSLTALEGPHLDEAVLRYGAGFASRLAQSGSIAAICVPVSAETLSWSRGRRVYQTALSQIDVANYPQIIPLIEDISPGTPPGRIAEMISSLRPYARRIAVSLPDTAIALDRSGIIGAAGFTLALGRRANAQSAARTGAWLNRNCTAQNAFSCVTEVNALDVLDALRTAGVRFAAGAALAPTTLSADATIEYARAIARRRPVPPEPMNDA